MLFVTALMVGCVLLLFLRWAHPWALAPKGELLVKAPLPLRARARVQRANVYSAAGLMLLGVIGGWLSTGAELALIAAIALALFIPVGYTLTDQEVVLGRTAPRRWSAFRDVEVLRNRAILRGVDGEPDMNIWLASGEDEERLVALLRHRVRLAARERRQVIATHA